MNLPLLQPDKTCRGCRKVKPAQQFGRGGRAAFCDDCRSVIKQWTLYREECERARTRERPTRLLNDFALSVEDYEQMQSAQDGKCAICGSKPNGKRLAVDHDHSTGAVRGLLCSNCNSGLGLFADDEGRLRHAIEYLASR